MRPELPVPEHGCKGYQRGCRCEECTSANTAYSARLRLQRHQRLRDNPDLPVNHGTINVYLNWGCRCEECYLAYSDYQHAQRMAQGVISRGPVRRRHRSQAQPFGREWLDA